eukprot:3213302-Amphidinium_carterae.1
MSIKVRSEGLLVRMALVFLASKVYFPPFLSDSVLLDNLSFCDTIEAPAVAGELAILATNSPIKVHKETCTMPFGV